MDRKDALALAGRLLLMFGTASRTDQQELKLLLNAYADHLEEFDQRPAELAVLQLEASSTFLPRPAELRQAIVAITDPQPPTLDADSAWGQVVDQIHQVGWCGTPTLDLLVAETVSNVGGWLRVCETDAGIMRKHFTDAYRLAAARHRQQRAQTALPAEVREALDRRPMMVTRAELAAPERRQDAPLALPAPLPDADKRFEEALAAAGNVGRSVDATRENPAAVEARREASRLYLERLRENEPVGEHAAQ